MMKVINCASDLHDTMLGDDFESDVHIEKRKEDERFPPSLDMIKILISSKKNNTDRRFACSKIHCQTRTMPKR